MGDLFKLLCAQHEPQLFSQQDTLYSIPGMLRFRIGRITLDNPLLSVLLRKLEEKGGRVSSVSVPPGQKKLFSLVTWFWRNYLCVYLGFLVPPWLSQILITWGQLANNIIIIIFSASCNSYRRMSNPKRRYATWLSAAQHSSLWCKYRPKSSFRNLLPGSWR